MEKCLSRNLGSLWPPPCAAKWRRQKRERLDAEKNTRSHLRLVTKTFLGDPLSFVVGGNNYVATQGFLVSPQLAISMTNLRQELINIASQSPSFVVKQNSTLATVIHVKSRAITCDWLRQLVNEWLARDDVFVRPFLSKIMFLGVHMSEVVIKDDACDLLRDWGCQYTMVSIDDFDSQPAPGPYLMKPGSLWQARRIYDDSNDTLLTAILPDAERLVLQPYRVTD